MLSKACNDTNTSMDKWLSRLESCGWLTHIKDVLSSACLVAQCMDQEGWYHYITFYFYCLEYFDSFNFVVQALQS